MTSSALTRPGERERLSVKISQLNWNFALLITCIAALGTLMLYSLAGMNWMPWAAPHAIRYLVLFVMMLGLSLVDLRVWFAAAYPAYAISLVLLVFVELFGATRLGAQRWLSLGPLNFQPSEIMKLAMVLALARWYHGAKAREARFSWNLLIPAAMIMVPATLVMHQPDLGTAMLLMFTGIAVMILAGLDWKVVMTGLLSAVAIVPTAYFFVLHDYQRKRIDILLDPESDPSGAGYHITQAKIAAGSGGLMGKGLGLGSQSQLDFLPEKQTDFIFSATAEEIGFVGCAVILFFYGWVIFSALRIASLSHSHFGRLASAGVISTFALYVLINGAMVLGLAPVVGVPMPLLSNGGSVMMTVMFGFGLVMSTHVHRYQELPSGRGQLF